MCKQDCDFSSLIAAGYTNDIQGFYKNISKCISNMRANNDTNVNYNNDEPNFDIDRY